MKSIRSIVVIATLIVFSNLNSYAQEWLYSQHLKVTANACELRGLTLDSDTNLYVTAYHRPDVTYTGPSGTKVYTSQGKQDILILKLAPNGDTLWTKNIYGTDSDYPRQIALDNNDNPYVTGIYRLSNLTIDQNVLSAPTDKPVGAKYYDIFLAQYSSQGSLIFARQISKGPGDNKVDKIAVDNSNNIYMTGEFTDSIFFDNDTLWAPNITDKYLFLAKFKPNGDFIWAKEFPVSTTTGNFLDIEVVQDSIVYMSGFFTGDLTLDGTIVTSDGNAEDIVLAKLDSAGSLIWVRTAGSADLADRANGLTTDADASAYITGYFSDTANFSGTELESAGSTDMFLAKYNRSGTLIWASRNGGLGADIAYGAKINENLLQTTGYYCDSVTFNNKTIRSNSISDQNTGFFVYDTDGNPITAEGIPTDATGGEDRGAYIEYDLNGNTYVGGYFKSDSLYIGGDTLFNGSGKANGFVAKYSNPFSATFTTKTNVSCNGGNDGKLDVTTYFGTGPYTYEWAAPIADSTTASVSGLSSGIYAVKVKSSNNDSTTILVNITEPAAITIDLDSTVVTCNGDGDGSASVISSGGTGVHSYTWTGGNSVPGNTNSQSNLEAGMYYITVTDENNCTALDSIEVTEPDNITFGPVSMVVEAPADSYTGSITLDVKGGNPTYTYSWDSAGIVYSGETTNTLANRTEGYYSAHITDLKSCTADTTILLLGQKFRVQVTGVDVSCYNQNNGSASVDTVAGGENLPVNYTWYNSSNIDITSASDSSIITNLAPGWYKVVATNTSYTSIDSVLITQPDTLALTLKADSVLCYGGNSGSITLNKVGGTGPYTYNWSNGAVTQSVSSLPAGWHTVTVTDKNGCVTVDSALVEQFDSILINITETQAISCINIADGILQADVSGGLAPYSYSWNDGGFQDQSQAVGLSDGTYTVTITDGNSCVNANSYVLSDPLAITFFHVDSTDISCFGNTDGSIGVTMAGGTGAYTYNWSHTLPDTSLVEDLAADTYTLSVNDENNCFSDELSIKLEGPATALDIVEDIPSHIDNTCYGDAVGYIALNATGGWTAEYKYSINKIDWRSIAFYNDLIAGSYTAYVRDANNCVDSTSAEITESDEIVINSESVIDETIRITAIGGSSALSYILNGTGTPQATGVFDNLSNGTYFVDVTDDNNCGPVSSNNLTVGPSSIQNIDKSISKLYPNPSNGEFNLVFEVPENGEFNIKVFSLTGQMVFEETHFAQAGESLPIAIDLSNNAKGIYLMKINGLLLQTKLIVD